MQNNTISSNEINIFNFFFLLKKYKHLFVGIPVLAMTLALIIASQVAPEWESSALLQIGHLSSNPVEPLQVLTPKLMNKNFLKAIESHLEGSPNLTRTLSEFESSFKVAPRRGSEQLLEISLRSSSFDAAANLVKLITNSIISSHSKVTEPAIQKLQAQLAGLIDDKKRLESEFKILQLQITRKSNPSLFMFTAYSLQNLLTEIKETKKEIANLDEQLNPLKTYPTSLVGEISTSGPLTPSKLIISITTFIFSFLIVLGIVYLRQLMTGCD